MTVDEMENHVMSALLYLEEKFKHLNEIKFRVNLTSMALLKRDLRFKGWALMYHMAFKEREFQGATRLQVDYSPMVFCDSCMKMAEQIERTLKHHKLIP